MAHRAAISPREKGSHQRLRRAEADALAQAVVAELERWSRRAEADFGLLGALASGPLGPADSVASALPKAVRLHDGRGAAVLTRCRRAVGIVRLGLQADTGNCRALTCSTTAAAPPFSPAP